jgi:hypothetical protein
MIKKITKIAVLSLFTAALIGMPALSRAEGTNAPAGSGQTMQPKLQKLSLPFHGKVAAVDAKAMTLTVGKMVIQVSDNTKITKDGKSATLADGVVGEPVGGAYNKTDGGKLNAIVIHFGAKGEKNKPEASDAGGSK